jgi:aminopeptidase
MDPRVERLAELIVGYSLGLRERQVMRIDGPVVATPLIAALHRAALRAGAHPYANVQLEGIEELKIVEASDAQLEFISPIDWDEIERLDAVVTIWSESNTRALTRLDTERQQRLLAAERKLAMRRRDRIERGEMSWCGTLAPTHAHAQDAEMSLREYEDFVFRACHVHDGADPAAYWKAFAAALEDRARALEQVRELRIVGEGTDLTMSVAGRSWRPGDGGQNMPDGEVFTSPVEDATEGTIRFAFPATFKGREITDIRLRFAEGQVVEAEASIGGEYLRALLDLDAGARFAGEVAFGLNYEIDRFTNNILFDEKIGGTMHVALGMGFEELGGVNRSALHLDLICDLRAEGEVYADGELIWRAGQFLGAPDVPSEAAVESGV